MLNGQYLCRQGMQRLDPQDAGPAYRNVIGLPGGVRSPLFKILEVLLTPSFPNPDFTLLYPLNSHGASLQVFAGLLKPLNNFSLSAENMTRLSIYSLAESKCQRDEIGGG